MFDLQPMLTTQEVMKLINVLDPQAVYDLGKSGKIKGNQLCHRWRWSRESVEAFVRGESPASVSRPVKKKTSPPRNPFAGMGPVPKILRRRDGAAKR